MNNFIIDNLIFVDLWKHHRKAVIRTKFIGKKKIEKVFITLGLLIIAIQLFFLGLFLNEILTKAYPNNYSFDVFNSILIYLFSFDLLFRFLFQKIPVIEIIPYLILPINKKRLISFLLFKSIWSYTNFYLLLIIIPFIYKAIIPFSDIFAVFLYISAFALIILCNNFISLLLKILSNKSLILPIMYIILICGVCIIQLHFNILNEFTIQFGRNIINKEVLSIFLLAFILFFLIQLNKYYFNNLLYKELENSNKFKQSKSLRTKLFDKYGETVQYMSLELKLIFRNKRVLTNLLSAIIMLFLAVAYLMSSDNTGNNFEFYILWSSIVSGVFAFSHGQFLFNWESSYFDFIMTMNIDFNKYIAAKYYLFLIGSFLVLVTVLPFLLICKADYFLFFSMTLYTVGISFFFIFYNAIFNSRKIDLGRSSFFNGQGSSINQFLMIFGTLGLSFILALTINFFLSETWVYLIMSSIGLLFILYHKKWIYFIVKKLKNRKYISLENYR